MQTRSPELEDFSEVSRLAKIALEAGDMSKLQTMMVRFLQEDDKSRSASENLFIYRTLGAMYHEQNKTEGSLLAYEQAYHYDVRDMEVLEALAEGELRKPLEERDESIFKELLLFHRYDLKNTTVSRLYRTLAEIRTAEEKLEEARVYYEKALEVRPGDTELIDALLDVSEATGNEQAIIEAREKMLATLTVPETRAAVLVSLGDDYLNRFEDEQRAMDAYESALIECEESEPALQRMLMLAEAREDWEREERALVTLSELSEEDEEKCKYLLKLAWVYKEKLEDRAKAITCFNQVLDIKPTMLDVFQGIIAMLQEDQDFEAIEFNYMSMINRQRNLKPLNTKLIAVLCRNLGELRLHQLNDVNGAAEAYQVVCELFPENVKFHVILSGLYAQNDETLDKAIRELRTILRLKPDYLDAVDALAKCYRKKGMFDEAICIYRVMNVLKRVDAEGRQIVERFTTSQTPKIDMKLREEHWSLIRPETLDLSLCRMLTQPIQILRDCYANELSTYGIKEKTARVNLDDPTFFSRVLKNTAQPLGFSMLPKVYKHTGDNCVINAYLSEPSFLVNENMLSGRDEREVAFACAKAMTLMRPEFYLLQRCSRNGGAKALEGVIYTLFKSAYPALNIETNSAMNEVLRRLEDLPSAQRQTLQALVEERIKMRVNLNIRLYMESAEDLANRVGLLFCDDPSVIEKMLLEETCSISTRPVSDRVGSVLLWAMSDQYLALRKMIGIAVKA